MIIRPNSYKGVNFITADNGRGLRLVLCDQGASVYAVYFQDRIMVATPFSKEAFLNDTTKYWGQTVGPLALRYKKGRYKIGKEAFQMVPNERGNTLHSSTLNYGKLMFDTKVEIGREFTEIIFTRFVEIKPSEGTSADVKVVYRVFELENRFEIAYEMVPVRPALFNPTNHIYWNLGEPSVLDLRLQMLCDTRLAYDKDMIPKKKATPITPLFDFNAGKSIGRDIEDQKLQDSIYHGYDHYFFLKEGKVTLEGPTIRLSVQTDREGAQIYTDNYPGPLRLLGMNGEHEHRYGGVTFETCDDPRLVSHPVYLPDSPYTSLTSYLFETR